jgi:hypothetical protein
MRPHVKLFRYDHTAAGTSLAGVIRVHRDDSLGSFFRFVREELSQHPQPASRTCLASIPPASACTFRFSI